MRFVDRNGILVPALVPDKVGLGCPKCDDHELAPLVGDKPPAELMTRFLRKHPNCGRIETLELRGSQVVCTGFLDVPRS